jgi:hypothetical protein
MKKVSLFFSLTLFISLSGLLVYRGVEADYWCGEYSGPGNGGILQAVNITHVTPNEEIKISVSGSLGWKMCHCQYPAGPGALPDTYPFANVETDTEPSRTATIISGPPGLKDKTITLNISPEGSDGSCDPYSEGSVSRYNGSGTFDVSHLPNDTYSIVVAVKGPATSTKPGIFTISRSTPSPTVTLNANPTTVESGKTTKLTWSSTNATYCNAVEGPFSTGGAPNNSVGVTSGTLTARTTFVIFCSGPGGTKTASKTVDVTQPEPPPGGVCSSIKVTSDLPTNWMIGGPQSGGYILSPLYPDFVLNDLVTKAGGKDLPEGEYDILSDSSPNGWELLTVSPNRFQQCNPGESIVWTLTHNKNGKCGSANGGTFSSAPTTNLCNSNNASEVILVGSTWKWSCSGISGGTTASCSAYKPAGGQITVDLKGKETGSYAYGDSVILTGGNKSIDLQWTTTGSPKTCTASAVPSLGAWSGGKNANATNVQTGILNGTEERTYTITCSKDGDSATDSLVVYVGSAPLPTVTLTANPNPVLYGQPTTLTWGSTNANSCRVTQGAGFEIVGGATSGSDQSENIYASPGTFGIECTGDGGKASASTEVKIKPECLPAGQTVGVGQPATLTARGGNPYPTGTAYSWTSAGGTPSRGTGSPYSVTYGTEGVKTVTVTSDGMTSSACTVTVTPPSSTTGTIVVSSIDGNGNPLPSTWTITGPETRTEMRRVTDKTYENMPVGTYTISAGALNGYKLTILPETSQNLFAGKVITFTLQYKLTDPSQPDDDDEGPFVHLTVNDKKEAIVHIDSNANLKWTTGGVVEGTCNASDEKGGVWVGSKANEGYELYIPRRIDKYTLTLTCLDGKRNSISDSVTITVTDELPPTPIGPGIELPIITECNDGLDNDGDGLIDHWSVAPDKDKADPGCSSPLDPSELDDPDLREI